MTIFHTIMDGVLIVELCVILFFMKTERAQDKLNQEILFRQMDEINLRISNVEYRHKEREVFGK